MSKVEQLVATLRDRAGKGAARAIRREGHVPAVIYGGKQEPQIVSLERRDLVKKLSTGKFMSTLYMVDLGGDNVRVIARDVQFHPVTDVPMHVDLLRLEKGATIAVEVPVVFVNEEESPGLKRGGTLNIVRHEIELNVPVDEIPDHLDLDLTGLDIGDGIHISAVKLPNGVTPTITDRDFTIATIAAPSSLKSEEAAEEGEAAEEAEAEETQEEESED